MGLITTLHDPLEDAGNKLHRLLIVGMSGYLGSALAMGLRDDFEVFGTYNDHPIRMDGVTSMPLNCLNGGEIFGVLKKVKPDGIVFCAGLSSPDACQNNRNMAESLNLKAPAMFFKVLPSPVQFVYYSTEQVFSDSNAQELKLHEESSPPNPVNYYGQCKAQAEMMVMSHGRFTHIMRLGCLYGEPMGGIHNIRRSWTDWLQHQMQKEARVPAFEGQRRSHVYVGDVVRATRKFLQKPKINSTMYNIAGPTAPDRVEFSRAFARHFGFNEELVHPVSPQNSHQVAPRPLACALNSKKFETEYEFKFQPYEEGLSEYAERMRTGYTRNWI